MTRRPRWHGGCEGGCAARRGRARRAPPEGGAMPLTEEQQERAREELARVAPALRGAAPPERARLVREALERVGMAPTWDEWAAYAREVLGDDPLAPRG